MGIVVRGRAMTEVVATHAGGIYAAQGRRPTLNCAGQGCDERKECRRYVVTVNVPECSSEHPYGAWASFDIERRVFGDCRHFVRFRKS